MDSMKGKQPDSYMLSEKKNCPDWASGEQRLGPWVAWSACADFVWEREQTQIDRWNRELDSMLTFAGLFSAALTAFIVPYYSTSLTSAPISTETQLSSVISPSIAATHSISVGIPIRVNVLWFLSLVFSLSAASIGIYIKQWLTQLGTPMTGMPRQSVLVWYQRHMSVGTWGVKAIIAVVPILLQMSLILFLSGLVIVLWTLDTILFVAVVTSVGLLLLFSVSTAIMPSMASNCPYKSPQALLVVNFSGTLTSLALTCLSFCSSFNAPRRLFIRDSLGSMVDTVRSKLSFGPEKHARNYPRWRLYGDWPEYEAHLMNTWVSDAPLLGAAYAALNDDAFLDRVLLIYVKTSSTGDAASALLEVLRNRTSIFNDNIGVGDDAIAQIGFLATGVINSIEPSSSEDGLTIPSSTIELAGALLNSSSSVAMFEYLFKLIGLIDRGDERVVRILNLIVDHMRLFDKITHSHMELLINHIPHMMDRYNIRVALRITLEVLLACGQNPELNRPRIGQQLSETFEDHVPNADRTSSSSFTGPSNVVPSLQFLNSCLRVVQERAEDFIKQLGDEIEKLIKQDGGMTADDRLTVVRKQELRLNFQGQVAGFKRWRGIIPVIQSASQQEEAYIDYTAIASSLPLLFLQESDMFRFSSLFAM